MTVRALPWRGALVAAGAAAALAGPGAVLAYGATAIFLIGMPHGAGDLLVVRPQDRVGFVLAYLLAAAAVLVAWRLWPEAALAGFLLLSAAHFAMEARPGERITCALLPIAGPALLHAPELRAIFEAIGTAPGFAGGLAWSLRALGAVALVGTLAALAGARSTDAKGRLALGAAAALFLPPVAGFAAAFVILHAGPELKRRARALGGEAAYAVRIAPAMAGALGVAIAAAWWLRDRPAPELATLFGAISALAAPHMLVTPFWTAQRDTRSRLRAPLLAP